MKFVFKHIFNLILLLIVLIISNGCKLQEPYKNHGILFLENRFEKLVVNSSNKNMFKNNWSASF